MTKKPPETYREFLDRLADLFDEVPPESLEEAEQELRDAGLDPEAIGQRMSELAARTLARSPLNWRVSAPEERHRALGQFTHFKATIPETRAEIEVAIRQILEQMPHLAQSPAVTTHFRNFEEAGDEDLRSLLLELEFLRTHDEDDPAKKVEE